MATVVTGELDLVFETATYSAAITADVPVASLGLLDVTRTAPGLDLVALEMMWGPLVGASWSVTMTIAPAAVPLPGAGLLLGGALVLLLAVRVLGQDEAP